MRGRRLERMLALARRVPRVPLLLLIPSWATYLVMDRDDDDTDHLLFFFMPDLAEAPLRLIPNLTISPLVNTETDQIFLVTALIGVFGTMVERRVGSLPALGIFWGASALAAIAGAALFHVLEPHFQGFEPIERGRERVYNGGSAGGFALLGAFAATARWPLLWIGIFLAWEPNFWYFVSRDFTSVFHLIAITTGFVTVRFPLHDRVNERRSEHEAPAEVEPRRRPG